MKPISPYTASIIARLQARQAGALFYTGRPCKKHPDLKGRRYTSTTSCPACRLDGDRKRAKQLAISRAARSASGATR